MSWLSRNWLRVVWGAACIGLAGLASGCHSFGDTRLISTSGPGWRFQQGQAIWRPGRNRAELTGELSVARNDRGACVFDFEKTPMPMTAGHTTGTNWLIRFPAMNLSFGGGGAPPRRFAWLYLGAALDGKVLPKPLTFEQRPDGGWRLENTRSGEFIEGVFWP
jgi:hypothetical protein